LDSMATVKLGPMVVEARGKIGGSVFSRNKGGGYVRAYANPTNPQSGRQQIVRGYMATLQAYWRDTCTADERDGWESLAAETDFSNRVGDQIRISGLNLFLRTNTLRLLGSQAVLAAAPTAPARYGGTLLTFEEDGVSGDIEVDAIGTALSAGDLCFVWHSLPKSQGVNYYRGPWEVPTVIESTDVAPIQLVASASVVSGMRYHMRYICLDAEGRLSVERFDYVDSA